MWAWLSLLVCAALGSASGPRSAFTQRIEPVDFVGTEYYITGGGGRGDSSTPDMLEDLRRGHEGLIVKLNDVSRAIKEDELKLNNVFYKLGRHDTDLEGVGNNVQRLTTSTGRIEAKLNKHAYNVEFLRRQVDGLQRNVEMEETVEIQVATVRSIINRLEDRLTDALARLGLVENTTKTLEKRSAPHYEDLHTPFMMAAAARPPTLTVYPAPQQETCRLDWEKVGLGCYWFGGEELTYPEAVAACVRHGGQLLTLPSPGTQLHLLLARLRENTVYWTSGTDSFSKGNWAFLMTAQPVMPLHWAPEEDSSSDSQHNHRCAGVSSHGLTKHWCTQRLPYVCHILS
ncbi:uncharacterized protein LOC121872262 [Homarus americanus]|uniref:uncharacterized protein LOC121872262 n=1 Tax=Homarus americanus TaxID=6706 RepID=UPI001C43D904|nr:uncharacterized protein LOC121872262 [Homarus americanus]